SHSEVMRVQVVEEVGEFAIRARPWLERYPVEANVAATVTEWAVSGRYRADDGLWLLVLDGSGEVIGAALQTPPYELLLPPLPDAVTAAVAAALADRGRHLPGVNGPAGTATAFAEAWAGLTGVSVRRALAERMYDLVSVVPPRGVSGCARPATGPDTEL